MRQALGRETMIRQATRWLAAFSMMAAALCLLWYAAIHSEAFPHRDITVFWAAERLFLHHQNPYDPARVMALELSAGAPVKRPVMMLNPPSALPFTLPLGFFGIHPAIFVWAVITFACLVVSVRILWGLNGRSDKRSLYFCYAFAPALACVSIGQYSMVVLLGAALFLWLHRTRPLLAGLSVSLMATKPHLLLPVAAVALVWAIREKRYSLIGGAVLGIAIAAAFAMVIDPHVFAQFLTVSRAGAVDIYGAPNFSSLVHRLNPSAAYLQYLLASVATVIGLGWYWRCRTAWEWNDQGLILLAIAVITAPHSWLDDEVLMIPAVMAGLSLCRVSYRALLPMVALNSIVLVMLHGNISFYSWNYLWTSVAWLLWFLDARWLARTQLQKVEQPANPGLTPA
jgi:Glycosyltransferase family 87